VTRPFDQRRILLGVTGGIAAYKSAWIARLLTQAGAAVDVVLTRSAAEFIGAITFEALTGRPVHTALIAEGHALDHIKLARAAHAIVVAPATADFIARAANGNADDLLSACLLAATAPVLIVPAMNDRMWAHPQTTANVGRLGKMGIAIAAAAWRRGADVKLIAGPLSIAPPAGPTVTFVETTEQMRDAVAAAIGSADALIMAAAPADFRPAAPATQKIKKANAPPSIALEPTPDILASTIRSRSDALVTVGFALETNSPVEHGRGKLVSKQLDLIVVNDATEPGAGFSVDTNRVTFIDRDGRADAQPLLGKIEVADLILDRVERLMAR
jgi:phosphopantothenoylcysteine synthetase/decarboxylase